MEATAHNSLEYYATDYVRAGTVLMVLLYLINGKRPKVGIKKVLQMTRMRPYVPASRNKSDQGWIVENLKAGI